MTTPPRTRIALLIGLALAIVVCANLAAAASAAPVVSSNWSGYAVQRSTAAASSFSSVSGSWIQPAATCTAGQETYAGVWVGLGGFSQDAQALEQIGTDADCTRQGRAVYSTWFELVPALPVSIRIATHPGDEMASSVTVRGRHATLRIRDLSSGANFTTTRHLAKVDVSSAEWIVEAPSTCPSSGSCMTLPLTDFSTVSFLTATATAAGHTGTIGDAEFARTELELHESSLAVEAGRQRIAAPTRTLLTATPSALSSGGGSFSVAWGLTQTQPVQPAPETAPGFNGALRRVG